MADRYLKGGTPMVIAHIINDDGGVGRVVESLCNHQVNDGHIVYIFTANGKQNFLNRLNKAIKVEIIPAVSSLPPIVFGMPISDIFRTLSESHLNEKIIIHAHNLVTIGLASKVNGIPIVCTIHGLSKFPNAKETLRTRLQTLALSSIIKRIKKNSGSVIGVSQQTASHYQKLSKRSIETIYNGTPTVAPPRIQEKEYITISHIGDISTAKGWDCTLKAFAAAKRLLPDVNLRFVSAGKLCDIDLQTIKKLKGELSLSEKDFAFLGFVKNPEDIYLNTDLLILASDSEGLPMSILEAQSFGIPVLCTDVGGCSEIIKDGYNGFIIKKESFDIARKIYDLVTDKELQEKMRLNALKTHKDLFSLEVMATNYYKAYNLLGELNEE